MNIQIREDRTLPMAQVIALYRLNQWSAAQKPTQLYQALIHSHTLVSAWHDDQLVGLGNAISDGHLVVYYPHLLVHPAYHGKGIGRLIMARMQQQYGAFHMQMLTADHDAVAFYKKIGFEQAGKTIPMWIYKGDEH